MSAEQAVLFAGLPAVDVEPQADPCCTSFPWREEADRWRYRWFDTDQQRLVYLWLLVQVLA